MTSHGFTSKLGPEVSLQEMVWCKKLCKRSACHKLERIRWNFFHEKLIWKVSGFGSPLPNPYQTVTHCQATTKPIAAVVFPANPKTALVTYKHLGSRVAFYLGTKLHLFRSDVGQSWKRKNFHRLGPMFLPSKRQKKNMDFPWILRTKWWFLVFFFFGRGMLWIRKNQHPQKNASNFNQNRLGSRWFFPTSPGRLPRDDLVRVWATCPPEKVPEMDVAMSKAGE